LTAGAATPDPGPGPDAPLAGIRVLEVATHVFVPMAGAVLHEWGAQVTKVEHPVTGDPYRSLSTFGLHNTWHGVDPFFQAANRGKRSVGIDLRRPPGRELLGRLVATADVSKGNGPRSRRPPRRTPTRRWWRTSSSPRPRWPAGSPSRWSARPSSSTSGPPGPAGHPR